MLTCVNDEKSEAQYHSDKRICLCRGLPSSITVIFPFTVRQKQTCGLIIVRYLILKFIYTGKAVQLEKVFLVFPTCCDMDKLQLNIFFCLQASVILERSKLKEHLLTSKKFSKLDTRNFPLLQFQNAINANDISASTPSALSQLF